MPPLGLPKLSAVPVLVLAPLLGGLRDYSGYGHHGSVPIAGPYWRQAGPVDMVAGAAARYIEVADSDVLRAVTDNTLFLKGKFKLPGATTKLFAKQVGGSVQLSYRLDKFNRANVFDGAASATAGLGSFAEIDTLAVSLVSGSAGIAYVNGASVGALSVANTVTPTTDNIFIGEVGFDLAMVLWYPSALSAPEISDLHDYAQARITPRKQWPGAGMAYPGATFTGEPKWVDNIQTARVTLVNETSGILSNTGLEIVTGTWALTESAVGIRQITNVVAGRLKPVGNLAGADTFDTKLFTETGGVVITKNTDGFTLDAEAGDTITALELTAP